LLFGTEILKTVDVVLNKIILLLFIQSVYGYDVNSHDRFAGQSWVTAGGGKEKAGNHNQAKSLPQYSHRRIPPFTRPAIDGSIQS
jgi:hypothetical protein